MIAIIVPVFNAASYLKECLDSLFGQTYQCFHVVCVDDGSIDESLEILGVFLAGHDNMTVIHSENHGPSHARNTALSMPLVKKADFIMFLDADDALEPDYLWKMIDAQSSSSADIVCSSFQFYKDGNRSPFRLMGAEPRLLSGLEATLELIADKTIQSHSHCKLYKSALWNDVRFPDHIVAMEDQATVFKAFCKAEIVFLNPVIDGYLYRQTANSVCSGEITNKRVLDSIEGYIVPCRFDYPGYDSYTVERFISTASQALAACYLMMYPRYNKRKATSKEQKRWESLYKFVRLERVIQKYKPYSRKEKLKKLCYLVARPFYRLIYLRFAN